MESLDRFNWSALGPTVQNAIIASGQFSQTQSHIVLVLQPFAQATTMICVGEVPLNFSLCFVFSGKKLLIFLTLIDQKVVCDMKSVFSAILNRYFSDPEQALYRSGFLG